MMRRQKLPEQVREALEKLILSGEFVPGSQLPPERELAERFGVSRATVGEATNLLEREGLVRKKVGLGGTLIKGKISPSTVSDSLRKYSQFNICSPEDVIEFRSVLEPEIAAMAARNASPEDLARLEESLRELEKLFEANALDELVMADVKFHETLSMITNNEMIIAVSSGMHGVLKDWMDLVKPHLDRESRRRGVLAHRGIFEAIIQGDADKARELMRDHMEFGRNTLMSCWERKVAAEK